jgi:hypothetical protein
MFMKKLVVFMEEKSMPVVEIVDGNQLVYRVVWPQSGTVQMLAKTIAHKLGDHYEVHVVFEKYYNNSVKSYERERRAGGTITTDHHITLTSVLPPRDVLMKSTISKVN